MTPLRAQFETEHVRIVYDRVPGGAERAEPSVSESHCFDLAFIGHDDYPIRRGGGATERVTMKSGHGAIHGGQRVAYLGDGSPAEYVEITPSASLIAGIAEDLGRPDARHLGEISGLYDAVMWSVSVGARQKALSGAGWARLEADEMACTLTRHMLITYLGGRPRRRTRVELDPRRLSRVTDYVEAHLSGELSLNDLAGVSALSRYHFIRAFKATTGVTPFRYVTSRRVARAQDLLRTTERRVSDVSRDVGFQSPSHFRRAVKSVTGLTPSGFRASFET